MAAKNEEFNCSICLCDFRKPKLLPCGHTFCESCLGDYISKFAEKRKFKCPICRKTSKIPKGGASGFPGNIYVTDYFQETPFCDWCKKGVDSEFKCKDCDQFLCASCKTTHDTFSVFLHDVVRVSETTNIEEPNERLPSICQRHNKKFAVYCLTCSLVVCSKCSQKDHSCHDVNNISAIGDTVDQARKTLDKILCVFSEQLPELYKKKTAIMMQMTMLKKSTDEACKDVDEQVEKVCKLVTKQGEKLKVQMKFSQKGQECSLNLLHGDLKDIISELESRSKQLSDELDKFDSVDILTLLPEVKDKLYDTKQQPFFVPFIKIPEFNSTPLDENDLFQTIDLNSIPMLESIDIQFNSDECDDDWSYSFNFALDGNTLYISAEDDNGELVILIKSINGFPHPIPSLTLINKDKTKSLQENFDKQKQVKFGTFYKAGFIDAYDNFTVRLTKR